MDILIPQRRTQRQIDRAETKASEFRQNRYTSGSANLDDMIALGKAVILCDPHARKFEPKKAHYEPHPDTKLRRVQGHCDVCKQFGIARLFICGRDALEVRKGIAKFKRDAEYGTFVA